MAFRKLSYFAKRLGGGSGTVGSSYTRSLGYFSLLKCGHPLSRFLTTTTILQQHQQPPNIHANINPQVARKMWGQFCRTPKPRNGPRGRGDGKPEREYHITPDDQLRMSHRKARIVTKAINGLTVADAEKQLSGIRRKPAVYLIRRLNEAVEEAREQGLNVSQSIVYCRVSMSKPFKKLTYKAKGKRGIERRRRCKIYLSLKEMEQDEFDYRGRGRYVHMQRRKKLERNYSIPKDLVKPWLVKSQLDLTLEDVKDSARKLKGEMGWISS